MSTRAVVVPRRRWAGVSLEDRRAERRCRLLDAAFDLVGSDGAASLTVREVCRRAGLNARYFYESFPGISELLADVYQRTVTELYAAMTAASDAAGGDPAGRFGAGIAASVRFIDADRRRGRILFVEARGDPLVDERRQRAWRLLLGGVERDLAPRTDSRPRSSTGSIRASMLAGGFATVLIDWLQGNLDVDAERLVADVTDLALLIVRWQPPA